MSTELYEDDESGVYLTQYFGGKERGVCYQITARQDEGIRTYVQLSRAEMQAVSDAFLKAQP